MSTESAKEFLSLTVTSNLNNFQSERRFPSDVTVIGLKGKLELLTGAQTASMKLELRNKDGETIQMLNDDTITLAQLGVKDGMMIHVIDNSNQSFEAEDSPDVAFQLSHDEYEKREESALSFLKRNKLGRFDDEKMKLKQEEEIRETELAKAVKVGERCEVITSGYPPRRGEVKHCGPVHFKDGIWVGVQYDEPTGKNDGSIQGKRYFECKQNYGGFVRPSNVTCGDFPEVFDIDEI